MSVGQLLAIVVGALLVYGIAVGKLYQRYDNGHWGRAKRIFDTPFYLAAGIAIWHAVLFLASLALLGAVLLVIIALFHIPAF